jgi:hypothetical protein
MHARWIPAAALFACLAVLPTPRAAGAVATPEDRCEAKKLRVTGAYAACRLRAKAAAELQGKVPDYAKCEAIFANKFATIEAKAGADMCPNDGDHAQVAESVAECTAEVSTLLAAADGCPPEYQSREPWEVIQELLAAIAAQDWTAVACHYHENAFVIDDQGLVIGRQEIVSTLISFLDLFSGAPIDVIDDGYFDGVVRIRFTMDGGWIHIEDGLHTYLVRHGKIVHQTTHGPITFSGPPPE